MSGGVYLPTWCPGGPCDPCDLGSWRTAYTPVHVPITGDIDVAQTFVSPIWGLGLMSDDHLAEPGSIVTGHLFIAIVSTYFQENGSVLIHGDPTTEPTDPLYYDHWSPPSPADDHGNWIPSGSVPWVPISWSLQFNGTEAFVFRSGDATDTVGSPPVSANGRPFPVPAPPDKMGCSGALFFGTAQVGVGDLGVAGRSANLILRVDFPNCIQLNPVKDRIVESDQLTFGIIPTQQLQLKRGPIGPVFMVEGHVFDLGLSRGWTLKTLEIKLIAGTCNATLKRDTITVASTPVSNEPLAFDLASAPTDFNELSITIDTLSVDGPDTVKATGLFYILHYQPAHVLFDCVLPYAGDVPDPLSSLTLTLVGSTGHKTPSTNGWDCEPAWPGTLQFTANGVDYGGSEIPEMTHGEMYQITVGDPFNWALYYHVLPSAFNP